MLASFCGTPNFAAPELFDTAQKYAGGPVDMWAVGCTLAGFLFKMDTFFKGADNND